MVAFPLILLMFVSVFKVSFGAWTGTLGIALLDRW